ncbi:MAG TPA: hypothetical protein VM818_09625 [Vicinamibacterales bacterium]|nr:hypothetical protein [Vicinamibacterales bacterium]
MRPARLIRWASAVTAVAMFVCIGPSGRVAAVDGPVKGELFQTSDRCFACHNTLSTSQGEDISIGFAWRASMMANSARDPYWQAGVRRETMDHPESSKAIEDECSKCHMPMARYQARFEGREGEVFAHLSFGSDDRMDLYAQDGVSCSLCHQISKEKLGTRESLVGNFVVDTTKLAGEREEYGQFKIDNGETRIMRTSSAGYRPTEGEHIRQSELCATCHTLITDALGPDGKKIGSLPEQMPYQEWLVSDYRDKQSCQNCHMPVVQEPVRVTSALGKFREGMSRHTFLGGNFFVQRMLNKYRGDLGVLALPNELESAAARTVEHLRSRTAQVAIDRIDVSGDRLQADLSLQNLTGHKFPTAYPSRRAWLHVTVRDGADRVVFESGALNLNGAIQGNDNDADATRFEPHYAEISSADQVQIYEAIMADAKGLPTTGLLSALRFIKDNRLLPNGFNKNGVDPEITPQGDAMNDADFAAGGDRVRYVIALGGAQGPFRVDVELWFQPIAYRWAANLKSYNAMEPARFSGYYDAMASGSGVIVSRAVASR